MQNPSLPTLTRRQAIGTAGGFLVTQWMSPPSWGLSSESRVDRVGLQLYTLREEMQRDADRTLARVAEIGYQEVEFAGYFGKTPGSLRQLLSQLKLSAPSAHSADTETMQKRWDKTLDEAAEIGHRYLVCAYLGNDFRSADGFRRAADLLNRSGEGARKRGIQLAYHNHDFEFKSLGADGMGFDILLTRTDPTLVAFEMDLYWTVHGGQDPLAYFAKWPGRFPLVHVKDRTGQGEMTEVGAGVIPFAKIFGQAKKAGIRHYFVEHDQPKDAFASVTASYRALRALK